VKNKVRILVSLKNADRKDVRNLFESDDYRLVLKDYLARQSKGAKLNLAKVLGCQPGYLTQILTGKSDLSAEQAERFTSHVGWDAVHTQFFLLLVARTRAGTHTLKTHYTHEIERLREQSMVLKNRFRPEMVLTVEDQATFYSSWHYGALHVSVSIPGCDTAESSSRYFNLPLRRVNEVLQFLTRVGLIRETEGGKLTIGSTQVYVGTDSPLVTKHHTNWRMRAIDSFDRGQPEHLHYSSVISVSRADVKQIREIMAAAIQQIRAIVRASKDEACFSYAVDLFEMGGEGR
jgi:uncharacterized protein (TIGR02147 family)